jgi:hypothetical protein
MIQATSDANINEDWLRSRSWDLGGSIDDLLYHLGVPAASRKAQQAALKKFTSLPAWKAAPDYIRNQVNYILASNPYQDSIVKPSVIKVGKEGYIHGFICVRPPCGPQYTEAKFDSKAGAVIHDDTHIGKLYKNKDGTFSVTHLAANGTKTRLGGTYANRGEAAMTVVPYHDLSVMHGEMQPGEARDAVASARDALAAGDVGGATSSLRDAANAARAGGDDVLASHVDHIRTGLSGENAIEPKSLLHTEEPSPPVVSTGSSIDELMAQLRENWAPTLVERDSKLTDDEHKALSDYTYPERAAAVNNSLRHDTEPDAESVATIRDMDSALAKSHAKDDLVTYRGMAMDPAHPFVVGDEFTDNGFTSTTFDKSWAADWAKKSAGMISGGKGSVKPADVKYGTVPVVMRVMIPKGTNVTPGAQSAGEIIVKRGTRYQVTKISKTMVTVEPKSLNHIGSRDDNAYVTYSPGAHYLVGQPKSDVEAFQRADLTPAEKDGVKSWVIGENSQRIQEHLRNGDTSDPEVASLDSAIAKSPLAHDTILHHFIPPSYTDAANWKPGDVITDPGYRSTSKVIQAVDTPSGSSTAGWHHVTINAPTGGKALYVSHSPYDEVVLPRNGKLRIDSVEDQPGMNGLKNIQATLLSDENAVEPKPSDTALTGEIEPSLVEPVKTMLNSPLTSVDNPMQVPGSEAVKPALSDAKALSKLVPENGISAKPSDADRVTGDRALNAIAHQHGFDAPARQGDVDAEISRGGLPLYRGFPGDDAEKYRDQFSAGEYRAGFGVNGPHALPDLTPPLGNGQYMATMRQTARDYATLNGGKGAVLSAVLDHDAKIADHKQLYAEQQEFLRNATPEEQAVYGDIGRYGAARGYDAIGTHNILTNQWSTEVNVLNRGKLTVPVQVPGSEVVKTNTPNYNQLGGFKNQ